MYGGVPVTGSGVVGKVQVDVSFRGQGGVAVCAGHIIAGYCLLCMLTPGVPL